MRSSVRSILLISLYLVGITACSAVVPPPTPQPTATIPAVDPYDMLEATPELTEPTKEPSEFIARPTVTPSQLSVSQSTVTPTICLSPTPAQISDAQVLSPPARPPTTPLSSIAATTPTSTLFPTATPRPLTPSAGVKLPILMYHHLQVVRPNQSLTFRALSVAPAEFEKQMAYLAAHNYHTIYFSDLIAYFKTQQPLPENPIILTFDDGWLQDYTVAFPILRKYCLVGTFFPPTNWVDHSKYTLTWAEIAEMSAGGMEFGSHTQSHALMHLRTAAQNRLELLNSKQLLEQHMGKPVVALAYPGGMFNASVVQVVVEAGYGAAVTTLGGNYQSADRIYTLHRTAIRYWDTLDAFVAKLQ